MNITGNTILITGGGSGKFGNFTDLGAHLISRNRHIFRP